MTTSGVTRNYLMQPEVGEGLTSPVARVQSSISPRCSGRPEGEISHERAAGVVKTEENCETGASRERLIFGEVTKFGGDPVSERRDVPGPGTESSLEREPRPPEKRSFLTTIVGSRPRPASQAAGNSFGIERVLLLAAGDEEFKARLLAERETAIDSSGVELTGAERAILLAAPDDQLQEMITRLTPEEPERREFLKKAAKTTAAGALLGLTGLFGQGCMFGTLGARPDRPETEPPAQEPTPMPRGIQPDRP